ncbi:Fic family protein [Staphylococcus pseudintermedius]|uniref:Fic family protein n=1 Tax=Staphylococcus pseudintermedius TaxID=283734 RepID=UPI000C704A2B|nr:Fic family protein [Staphylococcus pseudintermedius]PKW57602.1 Fic family protein [Staphylococcus pseudintermedius]
MDYKPLKKLFHMYGWDKLESEYEMRKNNYSSYVTDIFINPIQDEKQRRDVSYPLFFVVTKELALKLEMVLNNSAKIKYLSTLQPGIANESYIKHLLINELQSTNETENVRSTKKEIAASINKTKGANKRFDGLVNQYLMIKNEDVDFNTLSDIRKIFDSIVSSEIKEKDLPDGNLFRKNPIGVFDEAKNKWIHRNEFTEPEIYEFLTLVLEFIKHYNAPEVFKIMASHFMFEYLHPFYDGNGRLGRYLLAKLLNDNLDSFTALTFSYVVNNNKSKYYKSFENASNFYNKGELTNFIGDMLQMLIEGQENIIETFENNNEVIIRLEMALKSRGLNKYEFAVLFILLQDKVFGSKYSRISLKSLKDFVGFSRNKINEAINIHKDKLIKIQKNPAIYEVKESFIEELLTE